MLDGTRYLEELDKLMMSLTLVMWRSGFKKALMDLRATNC